MPTVQIRDLGRIDYAEATELQNNLQQSQIAGDLGPLILVAEHPPTITIGRRGTTEEVVAPEPVLRARGVAVHQTDRGGQVTFHGPGQLVLYPLIPVQHLGLHEYMRLMEEAVIRTLAPHGVEGYRVEGRTGVWIGKEKICAMGIRVRRWWSTHGLALNVDTDLNYFGLIVPCGIRDRGVCSMRKLLGEKTPSRTAVRNALVTQLTGLLNLEWDGTIAEAPPLPLTAPTEANPASDPSTSALPPPPSATAPPAHPVP